MLAWGSITVGMAFVTNGRQLLIVRFLITYGMAQMKGIGGLKGWQWTFLLEGLPIIPLGLNNIEKQLLTNLLRNDSGVADSELISSTRLSWRQVRYVFIDWRIYLYGLIFVGNTTVIVCLTAFLPTLVESMGCSKTEAHIMTAPPHIVACVCCLLAGYLSSRQNEHSYNLAFCLLVALFGFILMLTLFNQGKVAVYASSIVACCGVLAAFPLLLSWLTNNVGGHTKRAMAISFVWGIGQIGGIAIPLIYRDVDKPTYRRGHLICAGMMVVSFIVTIILRICLMRENHRRTNLSLEEYAREAAIKEPCDRHPDVRYVL
ncbi:unnamed protein product [Didymodactylos carnosus]|uniref:Uncharacterized protein n=1 Tax=Didymodactylos carnosus TaxID=1234261 RepID=A0A815ZZI4_9BILA|nr:unnamed protein product [Didymodactylos carnosus]CAF4461475.1 unnamed protein product [Didymodactylos carnosus]